MRHKAYGFSLIELMVVFAIIMGLLVAVVPIGREFILKNRLENRVNTIRMALKYAQHQAQLKKKTLVLRELSDEGGWSKGMRLFVDMNHSHQFDKPDSLIREWHWPKGSPSINWHGFVSDHYLIFSPSVRQALLSGHFWIHLPYDEDKKGVKIIVNRLGRLKTET